MYSRSPYRVIPQELFSAFTMNKKIPVLDFWFDGRNDLTVQHWTHEYINAFKTNYSPENIHSKLHRGEPYSGASGWILAALENHEIRGKKVAVIGSLTPWIEAILLNMGNSVTTVEYNVPVVSYPNLNAISYVDFVNSQEKYDCVVTYSSIEHSGLGRYGDPLDPQGDVNTMDAIWTHLIDGGKLIWGAPVGHDALVWNAHRVYGRIRLPVIFWGFRELEWIYFKRETLLNLRLAKNSVNPVIVLEKCARN